MAIPQSFFEIQTAPKTPKVMSLVAIASQLETWKNRMSSLKNTKIA